MRILLAAPVSLHSESIVEGIRVSLSQLGHKVKLLDYRAIDAINGVKERIEAANRRIVQTVYEYKADLMLVFKGECILENTLKQIRSGGILTALYFPDDPWNPHPREWRVNPNETYLNWLESITPFFDHVACTDSALANHLHSRCDNSSVSWLPVGYWSWNPVSSAFPSREVDVVFVGVYSSDREEYFSLLKDFSLEIYGSFGWESSCLRDYYRGPAPGPEMEKAYRRARVGVNRHFQGWKNSGVNLRFLEIAANTCLVSDPREDASKLLVEGEHWLSYTSSEDLFQVVSDLLGNPQKRNKMAASSVTTVKKLHSWRLRCSELLQRVLASSK